MSILAKRALLAALTGIGLVLLAVGTWFTYHLGSSGSASFRADPRADVVLLQPSVLNRVDDPVTVTATTREGAEVRIGRTSPSDAQAVVGGAAHVAVTGAKVRTWTLVQSREGAGAPPADLAAADVWRQGVTGKGAATLEVDQGDAPEALVVTTPNGGDITSVTVTIERRTWLFQSLLVALVGLLAAVAGAVGLVATFRHRTARPEATRPEATRTDGTRTDSTRTDDGSPDVADADDRPTTEVTA